MGKKKNREAVSPASEPAGGTAVWCDMEVARALWRTRMRIARAKLLPALDVEFSRALEHNGLTAERDRNDIIKRKQQLRDVTKMPEIDAATTPEELMRIWPDFLGKQL